MSKEKPTSYEVSDEELVTRLMRASEQAGVAASGLCFDITVGLHVADMRYYKGVVLARLDGMKPSYQPGEGVTVDGYAYEKSHRGPTLPFGSTWVIARVWYIDKDWYLEFDGIKAAKSSPLYRAGVFRRPKAKEK